ncbi:MAG TPA: hypothetical protein VFI20_05680 [Terracidiphilus sp.]|nr:hypothetical protein [Terracidiphilus sp.]
MQRFLSFRWIFALSVVLGTLAGTARAQTPGAFQQIRTGDGNQEQIPVRLVQFEPVKTSPGFSLPAATVDYPHCLSDGSLVVHTIDWATIMKAPRGTIPKYNQIVSIVHDGKTQTIVSTGISDLTDFNNGFDIFPSDSGIYFLVQGTRDHPGRRGPGTSPAGIPLSDYHNYVARFDRDGSYKGATRLDTRCDLSRPGSCELQHLAVFPSGDMLVTEADPESSTLKVLYLKSSGEVVKQIDVPASRRNIDWGSATTNPDIRQAAASYLASVYFTAVGDNIVVWRANSNDPVVEVRDGGGVREVPLQIPKGWRFANMVASNDRWVVHLRTENTLPNVRMSTDTDVYYEVRPQDGSLAAKLVESGDIPLSIACESNGDYTSFKIDNAGKSVLLSGQ